MTRDLFRLDIVVLQISIFQVWTHCFPNESQGKMSVFLLSLTSYSSHCRLLVIVALDHTHWHTHTHLVGVLCKMDRPQPDNIQQLPEKDGHDSGGNRIRNPSKRATADVLLRPHDHWDRRKFNLQKTIILQLVKTFPEFYGNREFFCRVCKEFATHPSL
jgi:hypothetical protein